MFKSHHLLPGQAFTVKLGPGRPRLLCVVTDHAPDRSWVIDRTWSPDYYTDDLIALSVEEMILINHCIVWE